MVRQGADGLADVIRTAAARIATTVATDRYLPTSSGHGLRSVISLSPPIGSFRSRKRWLIAYLNQGDSSPAAECWLWPFGTDANGYGLLRDGAPTHRVVRANRAAWTLAYGPIPAGERVRPKCRNRSCFRPSHMALLAPADAPYAWQKGQSGSPPRYGTLNGRAKLTESQVEEIRLRAAAGDSSVGLARAYDVSPATIGRIVRRRSWQRL